jgi:hypothetical protein
MMQDQSLFTMGTGATLKTNMAATNKFVPPKANLMGRVAAPTQARNIAPHMSMNANQNVSMNMPKNAAL